MTYIHGDYVSHQYLISVYLHRRPSPPYQRPARKDPPRRNEPSKPSSRVSGHDRGGRGPSDRRGDARGAGGRGGARGSDKDKGKGGRSDKVRDALYSLLLQVYMAL